LSIRPQGKMNKISIADFFKNASCILSEGAVIERLRRNRDLKLDPFLVNSAFIYDAAKRESLETIYRQYLDIGREFDLPLLLSAPTWRASRERIDAAGFAGLRRVPRTGPDQRSHNTGGLKS
jgi:homocysteine S-methyltransferase